MTKINKTKLALLGATALFASTSAHAQVADTWTIGLGGNDSSVTSANTANITLNGGDVGTNGADIADGTKNSVSASALGASASAGFNVTSSTESSLTGIVASAGLAVTATSTGNVSNLGEIVTPTIEAGNSNSISRVALGASASNSASVTVLGGDQTSVYQVPGVTVSASTGLANDGTNDFATTVFNGTTIDTAAIGGGNSNSISAAAIGSSASIGASTMIVDGSETGTFNFGFDTSADIEAPAVAGLSVTSTNLSNVAIGGMDSAIETGDTADVTTATLDTTGLTQTSLSGSIEAGTASNSISASAIGSSAGVSYSATVYGGDVTNVANFASVTDADGGITADNVTVASFNGGDAAGAGDIPITVSNLTDISSATIGAADNDSANNSISVAGIGSSASFSFSVNDYSGGASAISDTVNAGGAVIGSTNFAAVNVVSGLTTPTIEGGLQNSIATTALGASASQGFSLFTK